MQVVFAVSYIFVDFVLHTFVFSGRGAYPYAMTRPFGVADRGIISPPGRRRRSSIDPSVVIPKELSTDKISAILAQVQ